MKSVCTLLTALLTTIPIATVSAQCTAKAAGVNYGKATAGPRGEPKLFTGNLGGFMPKLGGVALLKIRYVSRLNPGYYLAACYKRANVKFLHGTLLVDMTTMLTFRTGTLTRGAWSYTAKTPNIASLCGTKLRFQIAMFDVDAKNGIALSSGHEWTLGS